MGSSSRTTRLHTVRSPRSTAPEPDFSIDDLLQVLAEPSAANQEPGFTSAELAERLGCSHGCMSHKLTVLVEAKRLTVARVRRLNVLGEWSRKPVYRVAPNVDSCA